MFKKKSAYIRINTFVYCIIIYNEDLIKFLFYYILHTTLHVFTVNPEIYIILKLRNL